MLKKALYFILFTYAICVYSQQNLVYSDHNDQFKLGTELMVKEKYLQAKVAFEKYLAQNPDLVKLMEAEYAITICAIKLEELNVEISVDHFLEDHPNHPKANFVKGEYGRELYYNKNYSKAVEYLADIDFSVFDNDFVNETRFMLGYSYFLTKNLNAAENQFDRIKGYKHKYTNAANYYSGNIKLKNKDYKQALIDFEIAGRSEAYSAIVPYIIATIYYEQGNSDSLIAHAERSLNSKVKIKNRTEIQLLLGEAYFDVPDYIKASENLNTYVKSKKGNADKGIQYKLGYSLFQQEKYNDAIPFLESASVEQDSIGQFASYYVGECFLKSGETQKAINALEKAKSLDFHSGIKEEATFDLSKLYFEKSDFNKVINLCSDFIGLYPNSNHLNKVNELISEAFLNTNDYEAAIIYIESLKNPSSPKLAAIHQKVTYYHAVSLFNQQRYQESMDMFARSVIDGPNENLKIASFYWWGECYAVLGSWDKAIAKYSKVFQRSESNLSEYYAKAHYGIGYAYYNKGEIVKAKVKFEYYTTNVSGKDYYYGDALLRLADCQFFLGEKKQALATYKNALSNNVKNKAYAHLQIGELYKRQMNEAKAVEHFDQVINNYSLGVYKGEAQYRKALFFFKIAKFNEAISVYNDFLNQEKKHPKYAKALLNRGSSYANIKNYENAILDFDQVLTTYCSDSKIAKEALLALEDILTSQGELEKYNTYVNQYSTCNPSDVDNESIQFRVALGLYENGKHSHAITNFENFLKEFEETSHKQKAWYYLGNSYLQIDSLAQAIRYFEKVRTEGDPKHYEAALYRLCEISLNQKNFTDLNNYALSLEKATTNTKRKLFAVASLMKATFGLEKYDSCLVYTDRILQGESTIASSKNEALLHKGKSLYFLKDYNTAKDVLVLLMNSSKEIDGAEANYYIGKVLRDQEKYAESNNILYDLSANYSSFARFYEESFWLISENYISLNEQEHAILTLQSIIEYGTLPDILKRVELKLKELESKDTTDVQTGEIDFVEEEIAIEKDTVLNTIEEGSDEK